jgi:hypothetical protein
MNDCVFASNRAVGTTKVQFISPETGNARGGMLFDETAEVSIVGTLFTNNVAQG